MEKPSQRRGGDLSSYHTEILRDKIRIGICSFSDPSLVESKRFYPDWAKSIEDYLQFYSSQFSLVEVDSSHFAIPSTKTTKLWVQRTPDGFTFNIKAFCLFTQHPAQASNLPLDIKKALPSHLSGKNLYHQDLSSEIMDDLWKRFEFALLPLHSSGKLGVVYFQFPPWVQPIQSQFDYILSCKRRLPHYRLGIEYRSIEWLSSRNKETVLGFMRGNDLSLVCVDEPQGFKSSLPPIAEATGDIAIIRFNGRNRDIWEKPGAKSSERFSYYYHENEFQEWVPEIHRLAVRAREVHALFNTNLQDQAVVNARLLAQQLELPLPRQGQLALE